MPAAENKTPSAEMTPTDQIQRQIANLLGVTVSDASVSEFWSQVALALNVDAPADDVIAAAKAVLEYFDEPWDDDYREEDRSVPSIEAYETLYAALRSNTSETDTLPSTEEEAEEEDDGLGALPDTFASVTTNTSQPWIETLIAGIRQKTIILNPHWQRKFVWKLKKQRRLIESILLGLPIPSMLLFRESKTGVAYVIDGRQRLETLNRFTSPKPGPNEERRRFKTFSKKEEGWGPGDKLEKAAGRYYSDLPQEFKTQFDHTALVVHEFVDLPREKLYQIFRRYNTGAEKLRAAEIRNAVYQDSPLHEMMYRLAGELGPQADYSSSEERDAATTLGQIMRRKTARYGAYDFVGRYFGFSYMTTGTVAIATNDFMSKHAGDDVDKLRAEFIRVLNTTCNWYELPLSVTAKDGQSTTFHAFIATLQMVSTRTMLYNHVDKGDAKIDDIKAYIAAHWNGFVENVLKEKQNSTAFWQRQKDWTHALEAACVST